MGSRSGKWLRGWAKRISQLVLQHLGPVHYDVKGLGGRGGGAGRIRRGGDEEFLAIGGDIPRGPRRGQLEEPLRRSRLERSGFDGYFYRHEVAVRGHVEKFLAIPA